MGTIAKWRNKTWEVAPKKIIPLESLTTSFSIKADNNNDVAGQAAANVRTMEAVPMTFDTVLGGVVGVDVRKEIDSWAELVGQSGEFILGGERFGPERMKLHTVAAPEIRVDDQGRVYYARLTMSFKEDADEPAKSKASAKVSSTTSATAPGIASQSTYAAMGITSAASITASTAAKAMKKMINSQIKKGAGAR